MTHFASKAAAIDGVKQFYSTHKQGDKLAFSIEGSPLSYTAEVIRYFSIYSLTRESIQLGLEQGSELDYRNLKRLAHDFHSAQCPIGMLFYKTFTEEYIPSERAEISFHSDIKSEKKNSELFPVELKFYVRDQIEAIGSIDLAFCTYKTVIVRVPKNPTCNVTLKESEIENLVFEDAEETILQAKNGSWSVTEIPPFFNYPSEKNGGNPPDEASGRIEGKPHQFTNDTYFPGIKVVIEGSGSIKNIFFNNCKPIAFQIPSTIT